MKKHWLAVINDKEINVARVAVGKNKEMKVTFLAEYDQLIADDVQTEKGLILEFSRIKTWLQQHKIPYKKLKFAISSLGLITRVIALPQMVQDDLEKIITDHIDQYFTLNVDNYIIDYRILNKYTENNRPMQNVLIAAFPRDRMKHVWSMCKYLGFEPTVVDLNADCLARLYSSLTENSPIKQPLNNEGHPQSDDIAIVSFHKDKVEFLLLEKGVFFLYSDMEFSWKTIVKNYSNLSVKEKKSFTSIFRNKDEEQPETTRKDETSEKEETLDNEIKLNLSSYVDEDKNALQDEVKLSKELFNQTGKLKEPFDYYLERDRLLNELIAIEKIDKIEIDQIDTLDLKQIHAEESDESDPLLDLNIFYEDDEDLKNISQDEMQDIVDDAFFKNLAKVLPQLDFSINEHKLGEQRKLVRDFDSTNFDFDGITGKTLRDILPDIPDVNSEETLLTAEQLILRDGDKSVNQQTNPIGTTNKVESILSENEGYSQAALNITKKKEDNEEFVLEDLFIPLTELEQELEITTTMSDYKSRFGTSGEKLADLFIENLNEINELNENELFSLDINQSQKPSKDLFEISSFGLPELQFDHSEKLIKDDYPTDDFDPERVITDQESITDEPERMINYPDSITDQPEENFNQSIFAETDINSQEFRNYIQNITVNETEEHKNERIPDIGEIPGGAAVNNSENEDTRVTNLPYFEQLPLDEELSPKAQSSAESSIFDPLDLNMTNIGTEEIESELSDKDPREELENKLSPLLATLSELLSFFAARHFGQGVSTIYLTGEHSQLASLPEIFRENLGVQTLVGFPNGWKPCYEKKSIKYEKQWLNYACLYGLALRED